MSKTLNSFKVTIGKRLLDYRLGKDLDIDEVRNFLKQSYSIIKLWKGTRHILGVVAEGNSTYFLKLSLSEGISIVTKKEYNWNNCFNKYLPENSRFLVPRNYGKGIFKEKYFYLVTDYFEGKLLCNIGGNADNLIDYIPQIIGFSEAIQELPGKKGDYRGKFVSKAKGWFEDIPDNVRKQYNIKTLLEVVEKGVDDLSSKLRHGDFAPWHIIKLHSGRLGLIDGEHWLPDGVGNYDVCYFIQRVFSVLKSPNVASMIYSQLLAKEYKAEKLKIVLAARAIGGFLDESLIEKPDYRFAKKFKDWVLRI